MDVWPRLARRYTFEKPWLIVECLLGPTGHWSHENDWSNDARESIIANYIANYTIMFVTRLLRILDNIKHNIWISYNFNFSLNAYTRHICVRHIVIFMHIICTNKLYWIYFNRRIRSSPYEGTLVAEECGCDATNNYVAFLSLLKRVRTSSHCPNNYCGKRCESIFR